MSTEPPVEPDSSSGPPSEGRRRNLVRRLAENRLEAARTWGELGTVGLSFALAIIIGALVGIWLDRVTGWGPTFFIVFFILGFVAGVMNVYRAISRSR